MKLDTKNCVPANAMPQTAAAGSTPRRPFQPPITQDQVGRHDQRNRRADAAHAGAQRSSGRPVITASVVIGMAIEPKATGAVLASRQMAAA